MTSITIPNSVTSIGDEAFSGCSGLTSISIPSSVTSIGYSAFKDCSGLTSISIPSSVTSIGSSAFYDCSGLISITIPSSVITIGNYAFSGCSGLTNITIPNSVTSIGEKAFYGCDGLEMVFVEKGNTLYDSRDNCNAIIKTKDNELFCGCKSTIIPSSVTSIGSYAFSGCRGLTSITIPNSVTEIGSDAFKGCSNLTTVTLNCKSIGNWFSGIESLSTIALGDSVTSIGYSAFKDCSGLTSVAIGNNLKSIGSSSFSGCKNAKIYTKRGTTSILTLWSEDMIPYETGTDKLLPKPTVKQISSTQTTITVELVNCYDEYDYKLGDDIINKNKPTVIAGLKPGDSYYSLKVLSGNSSCSVWLKSKVYTQNINPSIQSKQVTASSVLLKASYSEGDAKVVGQYIMVDKDKINGNNASIAGLDPNTSFTAKYVVEIKYGDKEQYTTTYSSNEQTIMTSTLTLTTLQPKVATPGNVIVAAESNLDDAETNVGFEWRRTDWTDDFSSNTGGAFLYEGNMEGYIRNLNTEKLWKYRPYYESNSGKRYYGEWMGLDPTNTSFFEPTVHTYANVSVQGNQAEVKGYAMRGSDNVTSQGFFYWQQPAGARAEAPGSVSVPKNAMKAEADGNIMTTTLEGLDYLTTYCYVAFMTTSEGDTFYGELRTFETGEDTSGIEDIPSATKTAAGTQKVYDLNGRRIAQPRRGLNIIRTADGRTVKVMKK